MLSNRIKQKHYVECVFPLLT